MTKPDYRNDNYRHPCAYIKQAALAGYKGGK